MDFAVSIKAVKQSVRNHLSEENYTTLAPVNCSTAFLADTTNRFDINYYPNNDFETTNDAFSTADIPNDIDLMRSAYYAGSNMVINNISEARHYIKQADIRINETNNLQETGHVSNDIEGNVLHAKSFHVNGDVPLPSHRNIGESSKSQLINQKKLHVCNYCNKVYKKKSLLQRHIMIHTGEKPYACSHCDKAFIAKHNLQIHVKTHTGEKPYSCSQCNKTFTQKGSLQSHIMIHTEEKPKPYACSHCSKAFIRKNHLQTHFKTHTGEKPYACGQCDKTFTLKCNLKIHIRIHTGEKPYTCSQCNTTFRHMPTFQRHVKTHTREPSNCVSHCVKTYI